MVGPWPLSPHHDYLQYKYHVYLMHRGQNRGVTAPREVIFQFGMDNILEWNVDTNTEKFEPILLIIDSTSQSCS